MNILCVSGYRATNVGNEFYDLGIEYLLRTSIPEAKIFMLSDLQAIYWNRYNHKSATSFEPVIKYDKMDYVILSGPHFSNADTPAWLPILDYAQKKGSKIVFMSAGGNQYTTSEISRTRRILEHYKPYALISRDHDTYTAYKDLFTCSYDGICCAFFISEYFEPMKFDTEPYVVLDFEEYEEPDFEKSDAGFEFEGNKWKILGGQKKINFWNRMAKKENIFDKYEIVRTKNTTLKPWYGKYFGNNIFLSDMASDYLNIYANSRCVISDRVHACVGAAALGKPIMFLGKTPRARLFNSVVENGVETISESFVQVDMKLLEQKKAQMRTAVKQILL